MPSTKQFLASFESICATAATATACTGLGLPFTQTSRAVLLLPLALQHAAVYTVTAKTHQLALAASFTAVHTIHNPQSQSSYSLRQQLRTSRTVLRIQHVPQGVQSQCY
jgi:hypothetical protein